MTDVLLKRTQGASQTNQETTETVEEVNANSKNSFLTQNGQAGHDQSGPDLAQSQVNMETLEKQIEEIEGELSKVDLPGNEIHEQNIDTEDTSPHYTPPPQPKISSYSPSFTPHSLQNYNNSAKPQQNTNPIPSPLHTPNIAPPPITTPNITKYNLTPPPFNTPKNPTNNQAFPLLDVTHANTHPIITRTPFTSKIPNQLTTPQKLPNPTSPLHHTSKNASVSSSKNRAPNDTPPSLHTHNMASPTINTPNTNTNNPTPPPLTASKNASVPPSKNKAPNDTPPLATWKRTPRTGTQEALIKNEPLGKKRAAPHHAHQSELPSKKYLVSQIDNENILILAEAGSQPCQEQ